MIGYVFIECIGKLAFDDLISLCLRRFIFSSLHVLNIVVTICIKEWKRRGIEEGRRREKISKKPKTYN